MHGQEVVTAATSKMSPMRIEIFTTSGTAPTEIAAVEALPRDTEIRLFVLDGIQRLEAELSQELPADTRTAKQMVLSRLQGIDKEGRDQIAASAQALARAAELGIDRYPAVVFDQQWVLYGLTNLSVAVTLYRRWQASQRP
jgi:integrating conjugative element protein (TIGR03757 family)